MNYKDYHLLWRMNPYLQSPQYKLIDFNWRYW